MDVLTINPNRKMYSTVLNYDGPIRVVAPVNYRDDGEIFDWAAYIGCGDTQQVADHGEKLYHHIAAAMFPDLPIGLYRE